jgi:Fe-S cluster biogenesis protein NfuA
LLKFPIAGVSQALIGDPTIDKDEQVSAACKGRYTMKIRHTEMTPNPDALKFVLTDRLPIGGSRQFDDAASAEADPLAKALFALGFVQSVFYTPDFVTVTKDSQLVWDAVIPQIKPVIEAEALKVTADGPVNATAETSPEGGPTGDELYNKIQSLLNDRVRPALAGDGGGLEVLGLDGFTLTIRYQGACGSCPSSISGTLRGIEHLLQVDVDPRLTVISG